MPLPPPPSFQEFAEEDLAFPLWLVDRLLPGDGWTLLVASAKTGKSLLAMQLAAAMSAGEPFLGRTLERRRVLYIQLDAPEGAWQGQVRRLSRESRERPATYTRKHLPLYVLDDTGKRHELRAAVQEGGFGLVIWDALEKLTKLDLNTKDGCQEITDRLREVYPGPTLVIHHPRKPKGDSMDSPIDRASGHHYLTADANTVWSLTKTALSVTTREAEDQTIPLERTPAGLWRLATPKAPLAPTLNEEKINKTWGPTPRT